MKPPRMLIGLLVLASVSVNAVVITAARETAARFPHPLTIVFAALASSQIALLAAWLAFGSWPLVLRLAMTAVAIVVWSFPLAYQFNPGAGEWAAYFLLLAAEVAGPLALGRFRGTMVRGTAALPAAPATTDTGRPWQFSLRWMMVLTAVVAVGLASRQFVRIPHSAWGEVLWLSLSDAVLMLAALGAVLGTRRRWSVVMPLFAIVVAMSAVMKYMAESENLAAFIQVAGCEAALVIASLAVVRVSGYRLVGRRSRNGGAPSIRNPQSAIRN